MRTTSRSVQHRLLSVMSVTILLTVVSWLHGWIARPTSTSSLPLQVEAQVTVVPFTPPAAPSTAAPSTQIPAPSPTPTAPHPSERDFWQRFIEHLTSAEVLVEVFGGVLMSAILTLVYHRIRGGIEQRAATPQYAERMQELSSELVSSFEKVDRLIEGMQSYMTDRRKALDSLEIGTRRLEEREIELKERIATLEKVPIEALDYFIEATESAERRATRRDYYLFFAGLIGGTILSTIVSLLIGSFGLF